MGEGVSTGGGRYRPIREGVPVGYAGETIWVYKKEDLIFQDGRGTWRFADTGKALTRQQRQGLPGNKKKLTNTYFDKEAGLWRETETNKPVPYQAPGLSAGGDVRYIPHVGTVKDVPYAGMAGEKIGGKATFDRKPLNADQKKILKEVRRREAEVKRKTLDGKKALKDAQQRRAEHEKWLGTQRRNAEDRKRDIEDAHTRFLERKAAEARAFKESYERKKFQKTKEKILENERKRLNRLKRQMGTQERLEKQLEDIDNALKDPKTGKWPKLKPGEPF